MKNSFFCASGSSPQILTRGETHLMTAIWNSPRQEATVAEVHAVSSPLALTTVLTVMVRLTKKKVLKRRRTGRSFIYAALLSREQALKNAISLFTEAR